MNYLKLNSWVVAVLTGMCSLAACSDDNNGEGGGNGEGEEVVANNGTPKGSVDGSKTVILTKGHNFSLGGEYIIKAGPTLRIGGGVIISVKSDDATIDYTPVEQGVKIEAVGTASASTIVTSDTKEPGARGGVHIYDKAPIDIESTDKSEVGDATYGDSDPADNSGILKYIRLEYAGYKFTTERECNGSTFYGARNGTTLEYLEAYKDTDDGFEWSGGMANARYLVSTSDSDDFSDWTEGWSGKDQFFVAYQEDPATLGYMCDCLIEADNYDKNMDATLISCPVLANLTLIGANNGEGKRGTRLCVGTQAKIYNVPATDKVNNLTTETEQTERYLVNDPSVLNYIAIVGDIKASGDGGYPSALFTVAENHNVINQTLSFSNTFIRIQEGGADLSADNFFEKAAYKGTAKTNNEWTKGWTKL